VVPGARRRCQGIEQHAAKPLAAKRDFVRLPERWVVERSFDDASATAGNLSQRVFTSQFVAFIGETDEDASWSLSSLIPNFAVGTVTNDQAYPAAGVLNASGTGTFSSNPVPAPQPTTLARKR
jgi:hypothetical protein